MIPLNENKILSMKSGLYVVATPIGNLMDISFNAIEILKKSDIILCEDTRVSKKLLNRYNIEYKKLVANHKFNENKNLKKIISYLENNKIISIISDAGTPCISDPGKILINECVKKNINIFSIPGPSSVVSAISISGFSDKFIFYGFFPEKEKDMKNDFEALSKLNFTIVIFISAKKFKKKSHNLKKYFPDRKLLICKELTKMYEQHFRMNVSEISNFNNELKGEITLVISQKIQNESKDYLSNMEKKKIRKLIKNLSIKDIVSEIKKNKDISRKEIYNYCLKIKNENKSLVFVFLIFLVNSCVGTSSQGIFGTGVSIAIDPRSLGTQIDDNIMQKNLAARLLLEDKKYIISVTTKVLDGRIFITGKVDDPEEKLKITKMAWETKGVRSVRNNIIIKDEFNFKQSAVDLLITSQLRTALILNKKIKSTNYNIDTYKKKIYVYGIAQSKDEQKEVIKEGKEIPDVERVIASILLVEDLRIQKD